MFFFFSTQQLRRDGFLLCLLLGCYDVRIFNLYPLGATSRIDTDTTGCFYTKGALSVWTNFGKRFVVRLVMRL